MKNAEELILTIDSEKIELTPFDLSDVMDRESEGWSAAIAPQPKEVEMQLYKVVGNRAFFRDDNGNTLNLESSEIKELTDNVRSGYKYGDKVTLTIS